MNRKRLLKLFISTFKLSALTFGGGFVIVPLMREKFVNELHWLEEEEMIDLTAIAQSSPGAIAVNASIAVGYKVAGIVGAIIAVLGSILPPLIIISIVSKFYDIFRSNIYVSSAMKGMLAGIAAIILDVVIKLGADVLKQKNVLYLSIMVISFILSRYLHVNIIWIILGCILIGTLYTLYICKKEAKK